MNLKGFLNGIISLGIVLGLRFKEIIDPTPAAILLGALLLIIDLAIRQPQEVKDLFHPDNGGHFFFIPVWIIGILAMVILPFV